MIMYYKRYIEKQIIRKLKSSGAVLVAGPKFCGKTTTCMLYQKSFIKLNTKQTIALAKLDPKQVLIGENPRLIDEWQTVPDVWNQIKDDLDFEYRFGKYILTGSSTPADKAEISFRSRENHTDKDENDVISRIPRIKRKRFTFIIV
jgi:hypothetical protein